jgi:hypothetical protein
VRYRLLVGNQFVFVTADDDTEAGYEAALQWEGIDPQHVSAVMRLG